MRTMDIVFKLQLSFIFSSRSFSLIGRRGGAGGGGGQCSYAGVNRFLATETRDAGRNAD